MSPYLLYLLRPVGTISNITEFRRTLLAVEKYPNWQWKS